jgi:methionyl-tRNA synthetase
MVRTFSVASLKTESGLCQLNELLAERSYVAGTSCPAAKDLEYFFAIPDPPGRQEFPHLHRWHQHISAIRRKRADYFEWPCSEAEELPSKETVAATKKGRALGKEKKQLDIDCTVVVAEDRRRPTPGPLARIPGSTCLEGSSSSPEGRYYITTAINYANGWPHMGHAYEALTADMFARYHRLLGKDVYFLTGDDEHGQKIADVAKGEGLKPIEICDRYALGFQALNKRLNVSSDAYIRTTASAHKAVAQAIWKTCKENGDIYLDRYEGWYLVREERFITDQEAEELNFKDPGTGKPLTKMSEPSFFFRLSKYQNAVIRLIEENEYFIQPRQYRTEILGRLRAIEMRDLSISRGTFEWGIPCPEKEVDGKKHVMYVWFDALINYMSGVSANDPSKPLSRFWPADTHIIGKDISWFHAVIWPSMLLSAGMQLPKSIVVHGFMAGPDGRKMSKSYGNGVDPHDVLDKYPCDTVRWYLCRASSYGDDVKFSEASMKLMHNADLCDNLGNLVNRAVSLCGGEVPEFTGVPVPLPFDLAELKASIRGAFEQHRLSDAADLTVRACNATNKWIADLEPWKMKGDDQQALRTACLRILLEAVYVLAHFFAPFIPHAAEAIFKKLRTPPRPIPKLEDSFINLATRTPVVSDSVLFAVQDVKVADDPDQPIFSKVDVRVGKIMKAWLHPEADRLFCQEIDVGEPTGPRQIVSGLRDHYSLEELQGKKVLVVCNLTPAKLKNVTSRGMVLCAKSPTGDVVELLVAGECNIGDRVLPQGMATTWSPADASLVKKQKIWEEIAKDLRTDAGRMACYAGVPLKTEAGVSFLAPTLPGAAIG